MHREALGAAYDWTDMAMTTNVSHMSITVGTSCRLE